MPLAFYGANYEPLFHGQLKPSKNSRIAVAVEVFAKPHSVTIEVRE